MWYYNLGITYSERGWYYVSKAGVLTKVAPTNTPTLLSDILPLFKAHSRIDFSDDDALCNMYLNAAISRIEQWTGMPITPASYTWEVAEEHRNYEMFELPLRNTSIAGSQHGFESLSAPKWINAPDGVIVTWPLTLDVGFFTGASMPDDIKLGVFEMALSLYQQRSNPEMLDVYATAIMNGNFSRYWVPRV